MTLKEFREKTKDIAEDTEIKIWYADGYEDPNASEVDYKLTCGYKEISIILEV